MYLQFSLRVCHPNAERFNFPFAAGEIGIVSADLIQLVTPVY